MQDMVQNKMWFSYGNQIGNQSSLKLTFYQHFVGCSKSEKAILRQERTFYNRKGRSKTGKGCSITGKDVLKQEVHSPKEGENYRTAAKFKKTNISFQS